jgi:eukaryotic-like serine/threonine-protein kinase
MPKSVSSDISLSDQLRAGRLQPEQIVSIATQIGADLAAAHGAGAIHGNLTSACIMLRSDGGSLRARITGFGSESPTAIGQSELAPELRLSEPASVAGDIYGFGEILTNLAASMPGSELEGPWKAVARRCLDPEPSRRFSSVQEVLASLAIPLLDEDGTVAPSPGPPTVGQGRWGDFQLLRRLGQGAFGEVWRAWDPVLEREVALKLLLPRGLNAEQELATVVAEARAIARVRHPNIVSVYGVDRREGRVGFWSDFVRGRTLSEIVRVDGPLPARETTLIGVALCDALEAVHHAGLLHRDIKASNAMQDENGRVLLMDFGLSQDSHRSSEIAGTPNYMSPELRSGRPPTVQSDIYALGVLLLFLATGAYPLLQGGEAATPVHWKLAGDAATVELLRQCIAAATQRDPQQRFLGVAAMRRALSVALDAGISTQGSGRGAKRVARWIWMLAGLGAVLAAVAIAVPLLSHNGAATPAAGTAAYQEYLAAENALDRYDRPGNTQKAIALYQQTIERAPDFALAEAGLARADWRMYHDTSDSKWAGQATQAAAKADEINPALAPVQMTLGTIHVDQGQFGLGMQELEKAESLDPHNGDVHAALAEAYRQQGRIADAKNEYQTAMDLAPDTWRWPYLLGAMQIDSGDYPAAVSSLQSALAKTPDNARILYDLGVAYRKQNHFADAQSAYEKSIALDPRSDTIMALGAVMLLQGDQADAVHEYRRAVNMNPDDWNTWGNLAAALSWDGNESPESVRAYERAIALGQAQLKTTPEDSYLLSVLANYYAALHRSANALPLVRKSLALAPDDPDVLERAGESYEMLGNRENALENLDKALRLGFSPDYIRKVPVFRALRRDPSTPQQIRD